MKKLYKFYWDCGRQGSIEGLFVTTEEQIKKVVGQNIYFGEVLGKHSEIYGKLEKNDISIITDDQDFIDKFEKNIGSVFGWNPLDYIQKYE